VPTHAPKDYFYTVAVNEVKISMLHGNQTVKTCMLTGQDNWYPAVTLKTESHEASL